MEIAALNITPDNFIKPGTENMLGLDSCDKKATAVSQRDKELTDKIYDTSINQEQIQKAIEEINKTLALHDTRLEFSIHDKTKDIMVKVVDEKTGETIREVPPKRVLDMVAMAWDEMGLLVDEKA